MKKRIIQSLLAIACCVTVALSAIPTAEAAMRASVVTGKVTLNGQVIDNKTAKYPLLIYSNIIYFPMTYHLSRFMGVGADWNNGSKTLDITAGGARTAYAAETGKKQSGSVSVTLPSYKISVNGAQINNKEEKYPIFNYNGITYFPLTWAYAVDSFGWSYQWDAVNGLRIDTSSAPAPAPVEPGTGSGTLDTALSILNAGYASGGSYRGTITGPKERTSFDATLSVEKSTSGSKVELTATPFPFFDNGVSYFANYYAVNGGFASDEQIGVSGNGGGLGDPFEVNESSEKVYIGKCFLDCQFTGARSKHITDAKCVSSSGSTETWELTVTFASDGFTGYTASVSVDTAKSAVTQIVIRTANYTLTMTPA